MDREKSVELKPLRAPSPVEAMTSTQAAAKASPADASAAAAAKPSAPEKQ